MVEMTQNGFFSATDAAPRAPVALNPAPVILSPYQWLSRFALLG